MMYFRGQGLWEAAPRNTDGSPGTFVPFGDMPSINITGAVNEFSIKENISGLGKTALSLITGQELTLEALTRNFDPAILALSLWGVVVDVAQRTVAPGAEENLPAGLIVGDQIQLDNPGRVSSLLISDAGTGTRQVETATVVGTITTGGNATITLTAAGMTGSPKTLAVPVALADTAAEVAAKIRAILQADDDVAEFFEIGGAGADVVLTAINAAANDATMNLAYDDDSSAGLTGDTTSADTTAGVAGTLSRLIEDVDYTHDGYGRITMLSVTKGPQPYKASYIAAAIQRIPLVTNPAPERWIRGNVLNTAARNSSDGSFRRQRMDLYLVQLQIGDSLAMLQEAGGTDVGTVPVKGKILVDETKPSSSQLSQYGDLYYLD